MRVRSKIARLNSYLLEMKRTEKRWSILDATQRSNHVNDKEAYQTGTYHIYGTCHLPVNPKIHSNKKRKC